MTDRIVGFLRGPDLIEGEWVTIAYVTDGEGDFWQEPMHYETFSDYLIDVEEIREQGYSDMCDEDDADDEPEDEYDERLDYEL